MATTSIALIRQHAEQIKPPRALWVPFELGRPLGPPNDSAFQRRVIEAALRLLDRSDGPVVLEDFDDEAPGEDDDLNWQPPALDRDHGLVAEVRSLSALVESVSATRGYSNVGLCGLPIEVIAEYLARADSADPMPRPSPRLAPVQLLRFGADDLKAYYVDAATAGSGSPSSRQLWRWFWRETLAGAAVLAIWQVSLNSDKASRHGISGSLVPEVWQEDELVMGRVA